MFDITLVNNIITLQVSVDFIANILIYLAGFLWSVELIPQVMRTIKTKNVTGISPAFFAICLSAYVVYGLGNALIGNWNIVIAHIPSLILWLVMLILLVRYGKNEKKRRKIK